jgi:hypothetical protein
MTPEQIQKMRAGRRRWAEAKARGENPPLSRGAQRRRRQRAAAAAAPPAAQRKDEFSSDFGHLAATDPPAAVEATPEFKAALDAALAERLPAMFAALAQANGHAQGQSPESFAKALALQMAKFTGQGVGKTYVDPEELEKREAGHREMMRLLKECRETEQVPSYRVIKQVQLDVPPFGPIVIEPVWRGADRIQHDTEIDYAWIPNLDMAPINEPAKAIFAQFEIWVGAEMPEVSGAETLDSPIARLPGQFGRHVLNPHTGTVIRGAAASAVIRNDPALRNVGEQDFRQMSSQQAAVIRRGEDPAVRKKQVLGTLTEPFEMR